MSKRHICHVRISTTEPSATVSFYKNLCGWDAQELPEYAILRDSNGLGLGIDRAALDSMPGIPGVYISSEDVAKDLKAAQALGGKIVKECQVTPHGDFGAFVDPSGNTMFFWRNEDGSQKRKASDEGPDAKRAKSDDLKKRFEEIQNTVRTEPKSMPSNEELLILYALFKQATEGNATGSRPSAMRMKERAKWDFWKKREGLSVEEAMTQYIAEAEKVIEKYRE